MAGLATFLLCVGAADVVRTSKRDTSTGRMAFASLISLAIGVGAWVWLDVPTGGLWAWRMSGAALLIWIVMSWVALGITNSPRLVATTGAIATGSLACGLGAMIIAGDVAGAWPDLGDLSWANPPDADVDRALLVGTLLLVQLSTANILVRVLLSAAGVPAESNETAVKGGRWLGPMERIFILGFGVAGEFTAASAVVAAKALLRLPEVNNADGPDSRVTPEARVRLAEHSEYLLLGSFASWLIAAASIGLTLVHS